MARVNPSSEASVTFILDPFATCLWEDLLVIGCGWKWVSIYDLSIKFTKTTVGAMAMMAFSPISMNPKKQFLGDPNLSCFRLVF